MVSPFNSIPRLCDLGKAFAGHTDAWFRRFDILEIFFAVSTAANCAWSPLWDARMKDMPRIRQVVQEYYLMPTHK